VEAQAEVVGPYCFNSTDDVTWQNDDVASFGYDSSANIVQGNTHPTVVTVAVKAHLSLA
jgi:hypothetical protein